MPIGYLECDYHLLTWKPVSDRTLPMQWIITLGPMHIVGSKLCEALMTDYDHVTVYRVLPWDPM